MNWYPSGSANWRPSRSRASPRARSPLATASTPLVRLLSGSTRLMLRVLGVEARGPAVTEEEIHALLIEGSEAGVIEQQEHTMVRNVFRLDDRQLTSLMVPRGEVVRLDVEATLEENLRRIETSDHSRASRWCAAACTTCWAWSAPANCSRAACAASRPT